MKANELMIGDWVKSSFHKEPVQIESILRCDGYGWVENSRDTWHYRKNNFKSDASLSPIPLSPEILEKNGWKLRHGYPTEYEYTEGEYAHCYYDVKHKHCIIYIWDELTIDILIDCVHQLQHALRLCGLNDLADNFKIE